MHEPPKSSGPLSQSQHPAAPDITIPERRLTKKMIVKVSLPPNWSATDSKERELLVGMIYDKSKTHMGTLSLSQPLLARFKKTEFFAYFHAEVWKDHNNEDIFELGDRAKGDW